jgi:hypothetical protein
MATDNFFMLKILTRIVKFPKKFFPGIFPQALEIASGQKVSLQAAPKKASGKVWKHKP